MPPREPSPILLRILDARLIAVIRLRSEAALLEVAEALVRGGITCLELTMGTPGSVEAIEACRRGFGDSVLLGAGTVLSVEEVGRCADVGAQFIVSPGTDLEVIAAARARRLVVMPGAMTPTEILTAWRAGADAVKVFPARSLGPRYFADVRGPLPHIPLIPTGGIDASNVAEYLRAGAAAVGIGGRLIDVEVVAEGKWEVIEMRARELVEATSHTRR